jgi:hypothetical protein
MFDLMRRLDSWQWLSQFLQRLSSALSSRRGWPLLTGTLFAVISLLCFGGVLLGLVLSDRAAGAWLFLCAPLLLLHLAILVGFTGAMLAIPLGEGYRDTNR